VKLSVQCYTVRDLIAADLWGTLRALKDIGLNFVEVGGTFGVTAEELRKGLDDLGLGVNANHCGMNQLATDPEAIIAENQALGCRHAVISSVGKDRWSQGWATVAKEIEPLGAKLRDAGITLSYHNHAFEFTPEEGQPGLDILYAEAPLLSAQLDVYWVAFGNADPAAYIRKMAGRLPTVHLKDGKLGGADPIFLEVGQGDLDWDDILAACAEAAPEFGAIEQDTCQRDPLESVRMSVEFLRGRGITE